MPDEAKPKSNIDRLLAHLRKDSLAFRLVEVYRDCISNNSVESIRGVLRERLEQERKKIDSTKD
jgi:hypothetical protein